MQFCYGGHRLSFQENQHFAQSRYILCLHFAQHLNCIKFVTEIQCRFPNRQQSVLQVYRETLFPPAPTIGNPADVVRENPESAAKQIKCQMSVLLPALLRRIGDAGVIHLLQILLEALFHTVDFTKSDIGLFYLPFGHLACHDAVYQCRYTFRRVFRQ